MKGIDRHRAEVNVINQGLLPPECTHPNKRPITMTAADSTKLSGGQTGVTGVIILGGADVYTKRSVEVRCPVHFYEADIAAQAKLSYRWLASQNLIVNPRRHGLGFEDEEVRLFMPGLGRKEM